MAAATPHTEVPFLDLGPMHAPIAQDILNDVEELIRSGQFTNGPQVPEFEAAFAEYCGKTHCVGVASGLDGLRLALLALGLQAGDEVIVPAQTFVATFEAVTQAGGVPVPVDVTRSDYCIDVARVAAACTDRTRVVMPVHLFGQLADMRPLLKIAERMSLKVLADACQAHGASRDGLGAAAGDAAVFSFYPGKNLGALGDAGAVLTDDGEVAARIRALREHGQTAKYHHVYEGWTSRLDTIQAAALLRKLHHLDQWNAERRRAAGWYRELLEGVDGFRLPETPAESQPVWHLYVVGTADPGKLVEHLARNRIGSGRHYPDPPHLCAAYRYLGYEKGSFPVAERLAAESVSLPIFPGITRSQVERVAAVITEFFDA